jgi:hypothetical protein
MKFIDDILRDPSNNLFIGVILFPIIIYILFELFIKVSAEKPKLMLSGSTSILRKDKNGKDVYVFGVELYNSTKFLWFPKNRQTAIIEGYDVYSSLHKWGHQVHPIWITAQGESYEPVEFVSAVGKAAVIHFLAYYKDENYYYVVAQINDDHSITLGDDKIPSGSLTLTLVLRDNIGREYKFKIIPKIIDNSIIPVTTMPLSQRIEYIKMAILYFRMSINNLAKAFKFKNF